MSHTLNDEEYKEFRDLLGKRRETIGAVRLLMSMLGGILGAAGLLSTLLLALWHFACEHVNREDPFRHVVLHRPLSASSDILPEEAAQAGWSIQKAARTTKPAPVSVLCIGAYRRDKSTTESNDQQVLHLEVRIKDRVLASSDQVINTTGGHWYGVSLMAAFDCVEAADTVVNIKLELRPYGSSGASGQTQFRALCISTFGGIGPLAP